MQPNNNFRYSFNNRFGLAYVAPLGESDFKIEWTREDESRLDYKKEQPSKVVCNGEAYRNLLRLEQSIYRCEFTSITIERNCTGSWVPWFTGRISLNSGSWDLDRCEVSIKLDEVTPDQCFEDNKGEKLNLFDIVPIDDRRTVRLYPDSLEVETVEYYYEVVQGDPCVYSEYWGGVGLPIGWKVYYNQFTSIDRGPFMPGGSRYACKIKTRWARYKITIPNTEPSPGGDWYLIGTSGSDNIYSKPAATYGCKEQREDSGAGISVIEKACTILRAIKTIDNGMLLKDILIGMVSAFCPGVTVVSEFFQINPVTPTTVNYVTGAESKINNLVVYQKSDVKRPGVSGNATKAETTIEELTDALVMIFNARWRIVGNVFSIEHISFFTQNAGLDLTLLKYKKYVTGLRRYSYESEKIPSREEFKFMEASAGDFAGVPILYTGACVAVESKKNIVTHAVGNVTTDVQLCLNNPDSDSSVVDDKGLVFVAAQVVGSELHIISEPAILSPDPQINNPLSWGILHRDYHRYYRPMESGIMNNVLTDFLSVKPTKKGVPLTVPLCCSDTFNPDDLVTSPLGVGTVEKASFSFKDQMLTLELAYGADAGLIENTAPVAVNDYVLLTPGDLTPVIINVTSNDTDAEGSGTIQSVEIVLPPTHGTAVVSGLNIIYTPDVSFTSGIDNISYRIWDNYGEPSNTALISLTFL